MLVGWKAIAGALGVSTRAAQRYERDFGLPVLRPAGRKPMARRSDLAAWLDRSVETKEDKSEG